MLVTLRGERVVKEILQSPLNLFLRPASNCVLFVSIAVFTQSWPGSYSSVDVYYSVPIIST